ncbi:DUF930 domain-containing protein [Rhizobium aquaticum]
MKGVPIGVAASAVLHLVVIILILRLAPARIEDAGEQTIAVTMVPVQEFNSGPAAPKLAPPEEPGEPASNPPSPSSAESPLARSSPAASSPAPPSAAPAAHPPPEPQAQNGSGMIEALNFFASAILARPENRSARDALKTLAPAERNEQICDTEAMEQIRRADAKFRPDRLIAYALENTQVDGETLHAAGAAFRSAHRWFRLTFDCKLDAKRNTVTAFRFLIGDPIPSSRWSDLQLER